jgi:tRNA-splicing ligase RtcB
VPGVQVIGEGRLPVLSWAPDLEEGAARQALACTHLPAAFHHVAVMADGHRGYGVPIGAVLALDGAIAPYAVGNDIGCGMALVPTDLTRGELLEGRAARDEVMEWVQASVPIEGTSQPGDAAEVRDPLDRAYDALEDAAAACGVGLSTSQSLDPAKGKALTREMFVSRGRSQLGTLGSGNHFIELLTGPDDDVWILVHSGSRGVGGLVCNNFHRMALAHCAETGQHPPEPGLAWLPLPASPEPGGDDRWARTGRGYERALRATLGYAEANRRRMLGAVAGELERRYPGAVRWDDAIDIHHNDATLEDHYGAAVWVHRKGAVKAPAGAPTITPGSMGTGTVLGQGLGNAASFTSCAHGAGRRLSRGRARDQLDLAQQLATVSAAGGKVFASRTSAVLDEMPGAYKDLDEVMANQSDLVRPLRWFRPLATYKGAERPRRSRRSGSSRRGRHSPAKGG